MFRNALLLTAAAMLAAEPLLVHTDVFHAGREGYHSFRIPTILVTADGTLVAFAEGRKDNRSDPGGGDIDLVMKRSTDKGSTWSPLVVLDDPGEKWSASNPTPVLDRSNGRAFVIYNRWEPKMGTEASQPGTSNNQAWLRTSDDNGKTWSAPRDITRASRDYDHWGAMFLGPGGAIQTRSGRLIVPGAAKFDAYMVAASLPGFYGSLNILRAYALYSDDHGATWQRGAQVNAFTNENQMVELSGGRVMMDARQGNGEHRWVFVSADGGKTWSAPRAGERVSAIATSIERFTSREAGDDRDRILWTGITGPARRNLVVRVSYDEGQTFTNEKLLYGGWAAYSDSAVLPDKTVAVLWERGERDGYETVTLTRFNREFLEPAGTAIPSRR